MMFFNETPHRYSPIEFHTTNLPLINYLPDSLTLFCARRFSPRIKADETWNSLLRNGIRGGTEAEIINIIRDKSQDKSLLLEPSKLGMKDRIDLQYAGISQLSLKHKVAKALFKAIKLVSGYTCGLVITFAIQKSAFKL